MRRRTTGHLPHPRAHGRRYLIVALAALVAGCGDTAAPSRPDFTLEYVSDADQAVLAEAEVAAPTAVVRDTAGRPAARAIVRFSVQAGDGTVEVADAVANDSGRVSAGRWVLGGALGLHRVDAIVVGEAMPPLPFRVTAIPALGPLRPGDGRCPASDSLLPVPTPLPAVAGRVAARQSLTVVAIGSSSTAGVGASVPDSTYPALLQRHLRRLYPASAIAVHNAGRGGQTLAQIRARFDDDVLARAPQLVVLQTGTVDALYAVPLDTFTVQLREALGRLRDAGMEVVLLDSQRYPGFGESAAYVAFQARMRQVAGEFAMPVVRRYGWMSEWLATGTYGYAEMLHTDSFHTSDLTYSCTARHLAEVVAVGVREAIAR